MSIDDPQTKGEMLILLFEARRYDLASRSDRKLMAGVLDEAMAVEFERGKDIGKMIGWSDAKSDTSKLLGLNGERG